MSLVPTSAYLSVFHWLQLRPWTGCLRRHQGRLLLWFLLPSATQQAHFKRVLGSQALRGLAPRLDLALVFRQLLTLFWGKSPNRVSLRGLFLVFQRAPLLSPQLVAQPQIVLTVLLLV